MGQPAWRKSATDAFNDLGFDEKPKWIFCQQNTKWSCTVHTLGTTFGGDAIHDSRTDAGEAAAVEILTFIEVCIMHLLIMHELRRIRHEVKESYQSENRDFHRIHANSGRCGRGRGFSRPHGGMSVLCDSLWSIGYVDRWIKGTLYANISELLFLLRYLVVISSIVANMWWIQDHRPNVFRSLAWIRLRTKQCKRYRYFIHRSIFCFQATHSYLAKHLNDFLFRYRLPFRPPVAQPQPRYSQYQPFS